MNIDYHVEVDRHVYSVPYQLVRRQVEVRHTTNSVEISIAASAWRRTAGATTDSRPPWPSTCPAPTAHAEWTRRGSSLGRDGRTGDRSARHPGSCTAARTLSRAIGPC